MLVLNMIDLQAKSEVSSSKHMMGDPKVKKQVTWLWPRPFGSILSSRG